MRLHAFGSFCDFVMTLFSILLDNCLMRFGDFLPVRDFRQVFLSKFNVFSIISFWSQFVSEISCFLLRVVF